MKFPRATIKDVKLVQEKETYYLDLTYECEDEKAVYVMNIPRVKLPCLNNPCLGFELSANNIDDIMNPTIEFISGTRLQIRKDQNGALLSKVVIEEKTHKMTVAEIEKKLGYKIEIVSDK